MGLNWVIFEEMVENLVFYSWVWGEIIAAVAIFFSKIAVVAIDEREPVLELVEDHTVSTYNDIRMKDVEFLRSLYATSGLSIRPRTKISKIEQLKIIIEAQGMNPDEILTTEALAIPNRTVVNAEQGQIEVLNQALKQAIIKELQK